MLDVDFRTHTKLLLKYWLRKAQADKVMRLLNVHPNQYEYDWRASEAVELNVADWTGSINLISGFGT